MSSMATSPLVTLFFSMFLVLQSTTNAFNITEILSPYTQFGEYNSYLTDTGVANEINNQKAVTVLVVTDDQIYYFHHLPGDVAKGTMSLHVILGYYDESKLKSLKSGTNLATLSQDPTLIVDHDSGGSVIFKSGDAGPNMGVKLLSTIETQPPSISVLQIASIIKTNGGGDSSAPPPSSTPPPHSSSNPPTVSTPSPPRKALAPPPQASRNKTPPTPNASPNKPRNEPPPAPSSSTKGNTDSPPPSKTKPSYAPPSQTPSQSNSTSALPNASSPSKSLGPASSDNESPVALPPKPSSAPAAADVQAPGSDQKSSVARISCGNYLGSILMVFTAVWFLFSMS